MNDNDAKEALRELVRARRFSLEELVDGLVDLLEEHEERMGGADCSARARLLSRMVDHDA